jgi:natural product precursor
MKKLKKLHLKKETVANLDDPAMNELKGGSYIVDAASNALSLLFRGHPITGQLISTVCSSIGVIEYTNGWDIDAALAKVVKDLSQSTYNNAQSAYSNAQSEFERSVWDFIRQAYTGF